MSGTPSTAAKKSIDALVVEDDEDLRNSVVSLLVEAGFEAIGARNGQDALAALRVVVPRVIILDMLMPVMNGWDFRKRVESDPNLSQIPLLITTWLRHTPLPQSVVLTKPLQLEALLEAVRGITKVRVA